jgi:hypothetical protein
MNSQAEAKLVETMATTVKSGMTVIFSGNIVVTIFTSTILCYLWGIVNGLQLIAMTCLFRIKLPTNVQVVFVEILKLAAFDLF